MLETDYDKETDVLSDFSGGMKRFLDTSKIQRNEYALLINGRSRTGTIRPVKLPLEILEGLPQQTGQQSITTEDLDFDPLADFTIAVPDGIQNITLYLNGLNITPSSEESTIYTSFDFISTSHTTKHIQLPPHIQSSEISSLGRFVCSFTNSSDVPCSWAPSNQVGFTNTVVLTHPGNFFNAVSWRFTDVIIRNPDYEENITTLGIETVEITNSGGLLRIRVVPIVPWDENTPRRTFIINYNTSTGGLVTQTKIYETTRTSSTVTSSGARKLQGIYAIGTHQLVFISGKCYYKNLADANSTFQQLNGFFMSETAEFIYLQTVPSSTLNYLRHSADGLPGGAIELSDPEIASVPVAIVQDNINQPRLILPDLTVRTAKTFEQWNLNDREYIPVGNMMVYDEGILYIVSPNKKEIYRSVQGRALDFVIAVDTDGNKLSDGIYPVEASRLSHTVDFEDITAIKNLNIADEAGGFFVGTKNRSYIVIPDFTFTDFDQPRLINRPVLPTGPLNQFSVCDLIGDTALINESGIRSFNAVRQTKNEGGSIPFHADIAAFFENPVTGKTLIQDTTACDNFGDYTFFGVNTIYGYGILVYDNIKGVYVSLDIYAGVGAIKMFSVIKSAGVHQLFFYDDNEKLYQAFASLVTAQCRFYPRDWCSGDTEVEVKLHRIRAVFQDVIENGSLSAIDYCDRKRGEQYIEELLATETTPEDVVAIPFGADDEDTGKNITFAFEQSRKGWKVGVFLEWNCSADLAFVGAVLDTEKSAVSNEQQAEIFSRI